MLSSPTGVQRPRIGRQRDLLPWRRFWCPREGSYADDDGFLRNPDSEYARFYTSDAVAYEALAAKQCLVLLGEPGMGKSSELRRMAAEARQLETGGATTLYRDLREYESMADIQARIFESREAAAWRDGDERLLLFLDSLDEALLSVEVIASRLPSLLSEYPADRLTLRIACRTAEWPDFLGNALHKIWEREAYGVYEIVPLRKIDVRLSATYRGLDPEAFLSAVRDRDIAAFASKPNTLNLLLDLFTSTGGVLPQSQVQLYQDGLLHMCEGHDADGERRTSRRAGRHSAAQRFAIASRIAAITILGNRAAIWQGPRAEAPATDVPIAAISGGTEPVGRDEVQVDDESIRDVLANTGLFTSRGPRRMGWAHQTYAEYLAASWLLRHEMPLGQIEGLIRHPNDRERKFIPQLHELVAWLAGMDRRVRDLAHTVEPEILLRTDVRNLDEEDRAALVDRLLWMEEKGQLPFSDYFRPRRYDRLKHAALPEQLRPWIVEPGRHAGARELAIEIAGAAGATALAGVLADAVLQPAESLDVRVAAAAALILLGDENAIRRLTPLAVADLPEDESDELRGVVLEVLWPHHITSEALFGALTKPKYHNNSGAYKQFLWGLGPTLSQGSTPCALAWVTGNGWVADDFAELRFEIIRRAWDQADDPAVLQALADEVAADLDQFREWAARGGDAKEFAAVVSEHPERRRRLVERILRSATEFGYGYGVRLVYGVPPLLTPDDFSWLLDHASKSADEAERARWSILATRRFAFDVPHHLEVLYARRDDPGLAAVVRAILGPEDLDSPAAISGREHVSKMQELEALRAERRDRKPTLPAQEVIAAELDDLRKGRADAWIRIEWALLRNKDDEREWVSSVVRPSRTWVWDSLHETVQKEVLGAAREYLQTEISSGESLTYSHWGGRAAYQAFILLLDEEPDTPRAFPENVWERWIRVIVTSSRTGRSAKPEEYVRDEELLQLAYQAVPEMVIGEILALLRTENAQQKQLLSAHNFMELREAALQAALLELAFDSSLTTTSTRQLLSLLLEQGYPAAERKAVNALSGSVPRGKNARARVLTIAEALFIDGSDAGVQAAWQFAKRAKALAKDFALGVATRGARRGLQAFDERQLGELFTWLTELFPYPDPVYHGMHRITSDYEARRWRSACATELADRATPAAIETLTALSRRWPELSWLNNTISRAEAEKRRRTWVPAGPGQLLELAAEVDRRFVASAGQLMDLVIESVGRLEKELQGELPASANLWDEFDGGARPKGEEHLSDEITRHLRRDLIGRGLVVGREVQIRRPSRSARSGRRTDIYLEALDPSGLNSIVMVVEVKGSWNRAVLEGMEKQLVGQYLAGNPRCQHGLYVVGWYLCPRWSNDEGKTRTRRLRSRSSLVTKLQGQASALTDSTRRIEALVLDCAWASD